MHRLIVLACLWRQAAPALQYHVDIDGSHATIAYDAGNATAAARAFVAGFDIQTHGTCEDAACVAELVEAELDAFASREIAVLVVDACPDDAGETMLMGGSRAGLGADLAALLEREGCGWWCRDESVSERLAQAHLAEAALTRLAGARGAPIGAVLWLAAEAYTWSARPSAVALAPEDGATLMGDEFLLDLKVSEITGRVYELRSDQTPLAKAPPAVAALVNKALDAELLPFELEACCVEVCVSLDAEPPSCSPLGTSDSMRVASALDPGTHTCRAWYRYAGPEVPVMASRAASCDRGDIHCFGATSIQFDVPRPAELPETKRVGGGVTRADCAQHPDDSDDCVYEDVCLDTSTNRLALVVPDGDPRAQTPDRVFLRHDGLSQIPRATRPAPLPHRGFAAATYVNASSVVSAPYLPGWTALVFGDGPNNIRHQAKYLLPVAYALKRRGADPDSLERLAWMDCGAAEGIARIHGTDATGSPRAHGSEPAACRRLRAPDFRGAWLWFAGLAETLFGRRTQLMVDVGGDGWLSSREGVVCFERAVVPGESDYLVRGPADARWLRHAAYAAVGLPRLADHPSATNRTALVVDREDGRGLDADAVAAALAAAGVPAAHVERATLTNTSFAAQVRLFERASLVVASHGAGLTNMLWLREGAAVVELKQYGEYSTTFRDLAAVSRLQLFAVHARTPPNPVARDCPARWYPHDYAGAPAMTCVEFLHKNPRRPDPGIAVDASELAVAVGHAARAAGLVPVACTCDWHPWKYAPASARDVQMVSSVDTAQDVMDTFRRAAY